MSIGVDLQILEAMDKHLDALSMPVMQDTLGGIPADQIAYSYPFNVGYLQAIRDMKGRIEEVRQKLRE